MPTTLITSMSFEKSSEEPKNETADLIESVPNSQHEQREIESVLQNTDDVQVRVEARRVEDEKQIERLRRDILGGETRTTFQEDTESISPRGVSRRGFLKGMAIAAVAGFVPEVLMGGDGGVQNEEKRKAEQEPQTGASQESREDVLAPEYFEGIGLLRQRAHEESNEFFATYREQGGVGAWSMKEQSKTSGMQSFDDTFKKFIGEHPTHVHLVHTHPEKWVGKDWSPPSFIDIDGAISTKLAFEGKDIPIKHQAIDATGIWSFEVDPSHQFFVRMRFLKTETPRLIKNLVSDESFQNLVKRSSPDPEKPDIHEIFTALTFLGDQLSPKAKRALEGFSRAIEKLNLDTFPTENFENEVLSLVEKAKNHDRGETLQEIQGVYKKLGVTLSYEPFADAASVPEVQQ